MEEYVYVEGKKYRRGYTTGSSAAAATKAAMWMFVTKSHIEDRVKIHTPKGIDLFIDIENQTIDQGYCQCSVKKDGGDDIDATHMIDIYSRVELVDRNEDIGPESITGNDYVRIRGGQGVGLVTKPGLSLEVGRPAINPVPIDMIVGAILEVMSDADIDIASYLAGRSILVTISVPDGQEVAKNTFNKNLGILGGISIIGTSGIVEPMSDEGWKKSLSADLSIKKAQGYKQVVLVPGNIGYNTMVKHFEVNEDMVVKMSNFIGYMLMEARRLDFEKVILAGHIGKLIKLAGGIFNSHSRIADARNEIMIANLAMMGADKDLLDRIDGCLATDAMLPIIKEAGYQDVFDILAQKAAKRAYKYLRQDGMEVEVYMFDMDSNLLAKASFGGVEI